MKNIYTLFTVLFIVSSINAQDSIPQYFTGTEVWEVNSGSNGFDDFYQIQYFLDGSTTINQKVYWKVYLAANIVRKSDKTVVGTIQPDSVWGYVRQENKTIFYMGYYPPSYLSEYTQGLKIIEEDTLINYDFNIGDTLPTTWISTKYTTFNYVINRLDTFILDTFKTRKMHSDFIEGVGVFLKGSIFDPFNYDVETGNELTCFTSKSYNNNYACSVNLNKCFYQCDFNVSLSEKKIADVLSVFPNPSSSKVFLQGYQPEHSYSLRDVAGKVLWQSSRYKGESIALDKLQPGLYFIEEYSPSGARTQSQKLIKP